jgi:hypothetical protein
MLTYADVCWMYADVASRHQAALPCHSRWTCVFSYVCRRVLPSTKGTGLLVQKCLQEEEALVNPLMLQIIREARQVNPAPASTFVPVSKYLLYQ